MFNGPNIIRNGLVLYLDAANTKSYPTTGTTWSDLSGNGNNGTLINGPTFNGANNGSVVFDGVNDYVNCGGNTKPTVGITVNTWIYFNTSFGTGNRYLSDWHQTVSQDRWIFYATGTNQISWYMKTVGQSEGGTTSYTTPINTWINLSGTYDSTISGGINAQKFYVNGQLYASSNRIGTLTTGTISYTIKLGGQVTSGNYLNGRISQSSIYNRALSPEEVLQNYNATKGRFNL